MLLLINTKSAFDIEVRELFTSARSLSHIHDLQTFFWPNKVWWITMVTYSEGNNTTVYDGVVLSAVSTR